MQKHTAQRAGLHWDFRLEHGGVLWSWAVPKGPSMDPAHRRLAIHVEDHPLDYAGFQGQIPEGQYGAGSVETWDRGTWEPIGDPVEGMRKGELKFRLDGQRLHGGFVLVRGRPKPGAHQEVWFLIKEHDGTERPRCRCGGAGGGADAAPGGTQEGVGKAGRPPCHRGQESRLAENPGAAACLRRRRATGGR